MSSPVLRTLETAAPSQLFLLPTAANRTVRGLRSETFQKVDQTGTGSLEVNLELNAHADVDTHTHTAGAWKV